ncbi:SDR family oxidoreductase [Frigidibacter sp. MR17.14]|uniref:SDR family NAD(P)-dependent oxidoreductase n=1 Tax=Frigidibacter sp. MR17.14 TaxID=3126509 RepID=UPI003012F365
MDDCILITGAGSGIGEAIARACLAEGWRVAAVDRDTAGLERLREGAGANDRLLTLALDVTDEEAVRAVVAKVEADLGPLTGAVNSAGIGADVPMRDTDAGLFRKILEVNLIGSFLVAREAARVMEPRRRGSIINIASVSGIRGNKGRSAYGASKGGVLTMTKVQAVELGPTGLRVNAIAPGPIDTPLARAVHDATVRQIWHDMVPQRRYGTSEEVAQAAIFLLDGRRSGYITGQTLCVDGGFSIAGLMEREAV